MCLSDTLGKMEIILCSEMLLPFVKYLGERT